MKEDEIDIGQYIHILKKHWLISVLSFILVLGGVIAYTMMSTPVYEAKSMVVITSQDQTSFLLGSTAPRVGDLETQKVMILSSSVMNPVYQKHGVDTFTSSVDIIKNSNVLEITIESNTAENAMLIANALATSYLNYTRAARTQDANDLIKFIDKQIDYYNAELDYLNKELVYYELQGNNVTSTDKIEYQALLREITAKNKLYDSLLSKREEAGLVANLNAGNVNILSYAELPQAPIRPNIPLNIVLGVIMAIGVAFGAALASEKLK